MENVDFLVSSANKCLQVFRIMRSIQWKNTPISLQIKEQISYLWQGVPGFAYAISRKDALAKCQGNARYACLIFYIFKVTEVILKEMLICYWLRLQYRWMKSKEAIVEDQHMCVSCSYGASRTVHRHFISVCYVSGTKRIGIKRFAA
jgi:hypothetical protein